MSNSPATAVLEKDPACLPAQICTTQIPVPSKKPEFTAKDNIIMLWLVLAYSSSVGWFVYSTMGIGSAIPRTPTQAEAITTVLLLGGVLTFLTWSFDCFRRSGRNLLKGAIGGCIGRLFLALLILLIGTFGEVLAVGAYGSSTTQTNFESFTMAGCS